MTIRRSILVVLLAVLFVSTTGLAGCADEYPVYGSDGYPDYALYGYPYRYGFHRYRYGFHHWGDFDHDRAYGHDFGHDREFGHSFGPDISGGTGFHNGFAIENRFPTAHAGGFHGGFGGGHFGGGHFGGGHR